MRALTTIGSVLALVVLLGLAGAGSASASQSTAADASAGSAMARATVACSTSRVPSGYYLQEVFGAPNECSECQTAGAAWERLGGYKAYCLHATNVTPRTAWLYIFCQKCRDGAPAEDPVRQPDQE